MSISVPWVIYQTHNLKVALVRDPLVGRQFNIKINYLISGSLPEDTGPLLEAENR